MGCGWFITLHSIVFIYLFIFLRCFDFKLDTTMYHVSYQRSPRFSLSYPRPLPLVDNEQLSTRKKKGAARVPLTYPSPVDPRFYSYAQPLAVTTVTLHPPAEYAALVANAAEFQRRNNQSTQDRRRCCSTLPLVNL